MMIEIISHLIILIPIDLVLYYGLSIATLKVIAKQEKLGRLSISPH